MPNLNCPHGKKLKVESKYGVMYYRHEDGDDCSSMGSFSMGVGTIMVASHQGLNDPKAKLSAFMNNKAIRNEVYRSMAKMHEEAMRECVETYFARRGDVNSLYDELAKMFGDVIFENIALVHQMQQFRKNYKTYKIRIINVELEEWEIEEREQKQEEREKEAAISSLLRTSREINDRRVLVS